TQEMVGAPSKTLDDGPYMQSLRTLVARAAQPIMVAAQPPPTLATRPVEPRPIVLADGSVLRAGQTNVLADGTVALASSALATEATGEAAEEPAEGAEEAAE